MGWNSWNKYQCNVNETVIVNTANAMVSSGLKDLGYHYINIDDCWSLHQRDNSTQRIVPDPAKFPTGIKGVADKVHALGLKLGIYSDAGTNTCAGYPGSYGYEQVDAQAFSDWGVDYLKVCECASNKRFITMTPPTYNMISRSSMTTVTISDWQEMLVFQANGTSKWGTYNGHKVR